MLTIESLLLLVITAGLGVAIAWLFEQTRALSTDWQTETDKEHQAISEQTSLSLVVAPTRSKRPHYSLLPQNSDCIDAIVSSPTPDDSFMITTECIIFTGTKDECADFLEDRGIIPFEDTIEPFDNRLQAKMNELGVRVFRRNLC